MWPNPQEAEGLGTFTKEIRNRKLHFLGSAKFYFDQSRLEKKQSKGYFLMCSIVEDEVKNFEFSGFIVSTKS